MKGISNDSVHLRGAARVYVVDAVSERLEKAREIGAVPIDFLRGAIRIKVILKP